MYNLVICRPGKKHKRIKNKTKARHSETKIKISKSTTESIRVQ